MTLISGPRNAGKTRFCIRFIEKLQARGEEVKGIISPGLYKNNTKVGILVRDVCTGKENQLAEHAPGWDCHNPQREWKFNQENLDWGNNILKKVVPVDYLIVDEVGYLELDENKGWTAALKALDGGLFNHAFEVIRPELLEKAKKRWPNVDILVIETGQKTEELVERMLSSL